VAGGGTGIRVLIVEDDEATAMLERLALTRSGMAVCVVDTVSDAVALLERDAFSAVVLDHQLPDGTPWTVLEAAQSKTPRIPVILVTATGNESLAAEAIHRGVADYVKKADTFWDQLPSVVERVTKMARLEEATRWLSTIVESSDDAIIGQSLDGTITSWNRSAERIFGYSAAEMVGNGLSSITPSPRAEEQAEMLQRVSRGERVAPFETVRLCKDGRELQVSISISPIRDQAGKVVAASKIMRDVTDRKAMQTQLLFADRMASVGTLAAGVAHEINNPLAYVMANLDFITQEIRELAGTSARMRELEEVLSETRDGAERVKKIVRGLRTFARADAERREVVELERVLEVSINMAFNEVRHRAKLVKNYAAVPAVFVDESRLVQVLINLIVNAAHSIPEGNVDRNEIRLATRTDGTGRAVVEVQDTGSGIPEAIQGRIFDPFFTTKPIGTGTGLGLSICHGIVSALGGELTFESNVGHGTTFRVTLPAADIEAQPKEPDAAVAVPSGRRGRILIVDDEPMIVSALRRILARDHEVTTASDGRHALDLLARGKEFDVIFCDLMMPVMTGMDFHAELIRTAPDQAAQMVFVTGGAFTPRGQEFLDQVSNQRIDKPFEAQNVRALVRNMVSGGR
jgi:PAS domain S-box-containing protein